MNAAKNGFLDCQELRHCGYESVNFGDLEILSFAKAGLDEDISVGGPLL